MRKKYIQIVGYTLVIPIMLAASGFCFQKFASAAPVIDTVSSTPVIEKNNDCDQATQNPVAKEQLAKNHSSLLICCISTTHKISPSIYNSNEIDQNVPVFAVTPVMQFTFEYRTLIYYSAPVVSPPELSSIQSVILRV